MNGRPLLCLFLLILLSVAVTACDNKEQADTLYKGGDYDPEAMAAAIETAKSGLDAFIARFEAGDAEYFSVKAPVSDGKNVEHFWLDEITYKGGVFEGIIESKPGTVTNLEVGQKVSIRKEDVSDWYYVKDGKVYGNHTLRVLLDTMPAAEAAKWRKRLAK